MNLACSLGREGDQDRRRREVEEACRRAGFELIVHDPPAGITRTDDLAAAQRTLTDTTQRLIGSLGAALVVAPSPHDAHHGHEVVGRAARDAVAACPGTRLWLWGLWADLPLPTLFVPFGDQRLGEILHALEAHAGEVARNDYADLIRARGLAGRVLGSERVFGFGQPERRGPYAELLTEAAFADGEWWAGAPREPDLGDPSATVPRDRPLGWWMTLRSFRDQLADAGPLSSSPRAGA